jgi:hypothetical protein
MFAAIAHVVFNHLSISLLVVEFVTLITRLFSSPVAERVDLSDFDFLNNDFVTLVVLLLILTFRAFPFC